MKNVIAGEKGAKGEMGQSAKTMDENENTAEKKKTTNQFKGQQVSLSYSYPLEKKKTYSVFDILLT